MADEQTASGTQETYQEATTGDPGAIVRHWLDALAISTNDEEAWRKRAQSTYDLYCASDPNAQGGQSERKFNILHSNIQTICPALYNSTPIPDVRRRFGDADPVAKQVAQIQERCLSYSVDAYDFDRVMKLTSLDNQVTGRGTARVRYQPYVGESGTLDYEEATCELVPWKHFRRGPAKIWEDVPWLAFELFLTREELVRLSPEHGADVNLDTEAHTLRSGDDGRNVPDVFKRGRVWEIWDKERREIIFIAPAFKERPIRSEKDPLGFNGFFPMPRPLYAVSTSDTLTPTIPYDVYKAQAEELEEVSRRIVLLVSAVRARALYDSRLAAEMERLVKAEDADNVPVENLAVFADGSKLEDHIMWMPIDMIVAALKELYLAREQIKQTIYEITGIADILRGQTDPNETLGAQQIKQQWGSLRIQDQQGEIQRFARDLFRLKAELFATKFQPKTLEMMTGIPLMPQQGEPPEAMQQKQQVIELLKSDRMRGFRVDIESDSTIRSDMTRNQQTLNLFLQGTAQFAQAMGPIIMTFKEMTPGVLSIYQAFARNFKLGRQAEDALEKVTEMAQQAAQQPPKANPEEEKMKAELQFKQQEMQANQQAKQAELQMKQAEMEMKGQQTQQQMAFEQQKHEQTMGFEREKHANEIGLKSMESEASMQLASRKSDSELAYKREKDTADRDVAAKPKTEIKFDASQALNDVAPAMAQAFESNNMMIAELAKALMQVAQQQAEASEALVVAARAIAAPKRILRDRAGRVTGAETVLAH